MVDTIQYPGVETLMRDNNGSHTGSNPVLTTKIKVMKSKIKHSGFQHGIGIGICIGILISIMIVLIVY